MAETKQFYYAHKAMQKDAVAATTFGGEVLETRRVCVDSSSSSESGTSTGPTRRRKFLVAQAKRRDRKDCSDKEGKDCSDKEAKDCSDKEAKDCSDKEAKDCLEKEANDCSDKEAIEDMEAPGVGKRQPSKVRQSPRTRADAATSDAVAARTKLPPSEVRSTETAVVTVSMNRRRSSSRSPPRKEERSCKTKAVAAKKKPRQSISSLPSALPPVVERKHIKARADLQHKQRVVEPAFGDSSSEDQRACRSRGAPVKGSLKYGRVHESVQPARRRDDGHTRHQRRGTQDLQKKRARWPDMRSRSPVDARSCRKPLPRSSSSVSPPKKAPLESPPKKARLIPARRPQLRAPSALPQERYVQLEERAEPLDLVPSRLSDAFGAESTTWAPHSVQSRPPWQSTLRRISNLMFVTSYVAESADIACFTTWLGQMGHHCNVILCQSKQSAVAEWLMQCTHGGWTEEQEEFLRLRRVVLVTARVYIVLKKHRVQLVKMKEVFNFDDMTFAVAEIKIHDRCANAMRECSTKVGVGVAYVLPQSRKMPELIMEKCPIQC